MSPRVHTTQNALGPPIQSNDQQSTQFLPQADVQVLLGVVVPHIINFVYASPPQPSTAVHEAVLHFPVGACPQTPLEDLALGLLSELFCTASEERVKAPALYTYARTDNCVLRAPHQSPLYMYASPSSISGITPEHAIQTQHCS